MNADLTPPMVEALGRLCRSMVWADGRSVRALIRRGLVERRASGFDAMIGAWNCDVPTDRGRALYAELEPSAVTCRDSK